MKMINSRAFKWHQKYGYKNWGDLCSGYKQGLKYYSKWSRTKFLERSKAKTDRWRKNNPGLHLFKTFKCTVLKNKNVTPELLLAFKKLFVKGKTKGAMKFRHLTASSLYRKMLEVNK